MRFQHSAVIIAATLIAGTASAQSMAPQANKNAPHNEAVKSPNAMLAKTPAAGANSFTEGEARSRIGKAGYTHVSALRKDKDGLWQGMANWKGHQRHVALDYKGNVSSK